MEPPHQSRPKRVLLLTNIERGEANVFLAVASALAVSDPDIELHFGSFEGFNDIIASVSQSVRESLTRAAAVKCHTLRGCSMHDAVTKYMTEHKVPRTKGFLPVSFHRPLCFFNTPSAIHDCVPIFVPYNGGEMADIINSILEVIQLVQPDITVVDSLMGTALTACDHAGVKFICLSPNAVKDFSLAYQPRAAGLWKYPALFSGFSYPLRWYQRLPNILYNLYIGTLYYSSKRLRATRAYLRAQGIIMRSPIDLIKNRIQGLKALVSSLPEIDFPIQVPSHVIPCGPILLRSDDIAEADAELGKWLHQYPTIYINLGSLCVLEEAEAVEIAKALRTILAKPASPLNTDVTRPTHQVLWKLKLTGEEKALETRSVLNQILKDEILDDAVRIVDWIKPDPSALLQTGQVVCSIHHGGANSYNEAIVFGIPQIVLPQWTDCYDYAAKVEMLGVGRIGNAKKKPLWHAEELAQHMAHVLYGAESERIKERAVGLAAVCAQYGDGAANAAKNILDLAGTSDAKGV